MKKYKLTSEVKTVNGVKVYRIQALRSFKLINGKLVKAGDLGGWIESEANLSHSELCWVYDECTMYGNAKRTENAIGYGNSRQFGNSRQSGNSQQYGNSWQYGDSWQSGTSRQHGTSWQYGNSRQYGDSRQHGTSQQYGDSRQFGNSQQSGNSLQYGNSQQYGNSRQYGDSQQYGGSQQAGNTIDNGAPGAILTLISPTSGRSIFIGQSDLNICTGCFQGSIFWLTNPQRANLPANHWAFSLREQLLAGKWEDIVLHNL